MALPHMLYRSEWQIGQKFSAVIRHLCTGQVRSAKEYVAPQAGHFHTSTPLGCVEIRRSTLMPFSLHLGQRVMPIQAHVSKIKLGPRPHVFLGVLSGMKIERAGKRSRRWTLVLRLRAPFRPCTLHGRAKEGVALRCSPLKLRSVQT